MRGEVESVSALQNIFGSQETRDGDCHRFYVLQYVVIAESYDLPPGGFQVLLPSKIALVSVVVIPSIKFHD